MQSRKGTPTEQKHSPGCSGQRARAGQGRERPEGGLWWEVQRRCEFFKSVHLALKVFALRDHVCLTRCVYILSARSQPQRGKPLFMVDSYCSPMPRWQ